MKVLEQRCFVKLWPAQIAGLLLATNVYAYDSESAVPLTISADLGRVSISMLSIDINGRDVAIRTELKNETKEIQSVAFYAATPIAGLSGDGEEHLDKSFSDLRVTVKNSSKKVERYVRSYFNGRDITESLTKAKLAPFPDLNADPRKLARLPAVDGVKPSDWQTGAVYAWSDRIGPGESAVHDVRYRALPQFALEAQGSQKFEERIRQHCGNPAEVQSQLKSHGVSSAQVLLERYEIPLSFMAMREIHLNVKQPQRNWLGAHPLAVLACGVRSSGTTMSAVIDNADQSLSLLVVSAPPAVQ